MTNLYPDLSEDEISSAYEDGISHATEIQQLVSKHDYTRPDHVRCYDIVRYEEEVNGLEFFDYNGLDKASGILAGSLMIGDSRPGKLPLGVVGINSNMVDGRQNYTRCHETCHYHFDSQNKRGQTGFSNLQSSAVYPENEQYEEAVANFCAAHLMIPDAPLFKLLSSGSDLEQDMSREFGSSHSANYIRVEHYLIYELGYDVWRAYNAIEDYKARGEESWLAGRADIELRVFDEDDYKLDGDHRFNAWTFNF